MTDWTNGYVSDIEYTYGYYSELNPLNIKLAFLNAGIKFPEVITACELGFGQGISANIHAAASMVEWSGTDFNPSQAGFANELMKKTGLRNKFYDDTFEKFKNRKDLPQFDFIALHGVWSWVSEENRKIIVEFINEKLNVGGVVYISYNTTPGWTGFIPIRRIMHEHAEKFTPMKNKKVFKVSEAIKFAEILIKNAPQYTVANPLVNERINLLKNQNANYLAHEFFNKDWCPMMFSEVAQSLEKAKLSYVCSANLIEHIQAINLNNEQIQLLSEVDDINFRENIKDLITNNQFRKDYWVKGIRVLDRRKIIEEIREMKVILIANRNDIKMKINAGRGEVKLSEKIYGSILDELYAHEVKTIGAIENSINEKGIKFNEIVEAVLLLISLGYMAVAQNESLIEKCNESCVRINEYLTELSKYNSNNKYLASPVIAGGLTVGRFQQLFILAIKRGINNPKLMAEYVWKELINQGEKILFNNGVLVSDEENILELEKQAKDFLSKGLPILTALKIT